MFENMLEWLRAPACPHYRTATQTWFDDGAVIRRGVCLQCGKTTPPEPISHEAMIGLLDEALSTSSKQEAR